MNKKGKHWARLKCSMNFWNVKELDIYDIAKNLFELNQFLIARLSGNLCKIPFDSSAFDGKFIWEICEKKKGYNRIAYLNEHKTRKSSKKFSWALTCEKETRKIINEEDFLVFKRLQAREEFEIIGGFVYFEFRFQWLFKHFEKWVRVTEVQK